MFQVIVVTHPRAAEVRVVYKSDTNLVGMFLLICGMGRAQIKGVHL